MTEEFWATYEGWNNAIADVFYPPQEVPKPVYLDLEGERLDELGRIMGVAPEQVEKDLVNAVSKTLRHNHGPSLIFERQTSRMRRWARDGRKDTPPFLALLATFGIAAEKMSAGNGMSSNNYYGRLREVLAWDPKDARLDQAYRRIAERLWGELNRWLTELDGERGLPTAYALAHRYVGLSVSQALIRSADHERLKEFFRQFGFAPGADVTPTDLVSPLDEWISTRPCPVSSGLQRLWSQRSARDRIAEATAVSLATWDGSVRGRLEGDGSPSAGGMALTLEIGGFPRKRFALSAVFYVDCATTPRSATVTTAEPPADIELVPDLPGALGLGFGSSLHPRDVLEGVLRIRDGLTERTLERRPRRLVVFREDELSRRWIENPQVMLGDSVRLLAHEDLLSRLEEVLEKVARPGWSIAAAYSGQPDHWVVVTGVEIFSHPGALVSSKMDDLSPLVPLTSSQLKVAGGFALPGRVRGKWHSWAAPEIRAISDTPDGFLVRLVDMHRFDGITDEAHETVVGEWADEGTGIVVRSLMDLNVGDGDYRVEIVAPGSDAPLTTTSILLRSSDTPDLQQWSNLTTVGYSGGIGVLGVHQANETTVVEGHNVPNATPIVSPTIDVPTRPRWTKKTHALSTSKSPIRITVPDADSCIRTGRHHEDLETVYLDAKAKPLQAWFYGRCRGCGLVKRYSSSPRKSSKGNKRDENSSAEATTLDVSAIPPVTSQTDPAYSTAFDALLHTGGGTWSQLERIALQVEPTALFVDQFARNLEVLGHIDISRDPTTLQPTSWEVSPTAIAGTGNDYLFAGFWPIQLYGEVAQHLEASGFGLATAIVEEAPTQYFVTATSIPTTDAAHLREKHVAVIDHAWQDLISILPPLSEILAALPRQSASFNGEIYWFDTGAASWMKVHSMDAPGAYRIRRFSTMDVVRSAADVDRGTMARSTVHLSKHLAALIDNHPLIAYDPASSSLLTPLGADLPALYGRAVVASSGLPPVALRKQRLLKYELVPHELASHIYDLFSR